jgi:hypothetical membrane protein
MKTFLMLPASKNQSPQNQGLAYNVAEGSTTNLICAHFQSRIMNYDNKKVAGLLGFVAIVQTVLVIFICEVLYSNYNVGQQYISDLGNWSLASNYAAIFNTSMVLAGILGIASAYFIQQAFKNRLFTSLLMINAFCTILIGVFAEDISMPAHGISALISLIVGLGATFMTYKFVKLPLSYAAIILGGVTVFAVVIQASGNYLGLGLGGIERLEIYPSLLWGLVFDAYLIGEASSTALTSKT